MKVIDTVKPEPKTEKEAFNRWIDNLRVEAGIEYGKRIEIKQIEKLDSSVCPLNSRGRVTCERLGGHSWFNHSMDKAY